MSLGIVGRKLGMSQIFDEDGRLVPVTFIQAGPCVVTQVKTKDGDDGYDAVQVGFEAASEKHLTKPEIGHLEKAGAPKLRHLVEFRLDRDDYFVRNNRIDVPALGASYDVSLFQVGDHVDVIGTTKGRGFASPIKRWKSSRGPETHGSMYHRRAGSQGASSYPSRTFRGKHSAGQMGNCRHTVLNLRVIQVDTEKNLILVRGAVPGHPNALVTIVPTIRAKRAQRQDFLYTTYKQRMAEISKRAINPLKASKKASGGTAKKKK
jgi:large subunit ribosomal protein L3